MTTARSVHKFSAIIRKVDINPYVAVPPGIVKELHLESRKPKGPIPVKGKLQGKAFEATVIKFRGLWRLYLNTEMRRRSGIDVGDKADVVLCYDREPRIVPVPKAFAIALSNNNGARAAFEKLAPSRQREIFRYLNSLKREESLAKNIEKLVRRLEDQE